VVRDELMHAGEGNRGVVRLLARHALDIHGEDAFAREDDEVAYPIECQEALFALEEKGVDLARHHRVVDSAGFT
jgi:hypothetical protein